MRDDLCIGLAFEPPTARDQSVAQRLEIFDDAVVDKCDLLCRMRMGIGGVGRPMRSPARVRDAGVTRRGITGQYLHQVVELSLGPSPDQRITLHRTHPGRIIAAILHPFQPIDQPVRDRSTANNSDNSTHGFNTRSEDIGNANARHFCREILCVSCDKNPTARLCGSQDNCIRRLKPRALPT